MVSLTELESKAIEPIRPMPDVKVTGMRAWLLLYSFPNSFERVKQSGKIEVRGGREFSEGYYRQIFSGLIGQIGKKQIREGEVEEIGLTEMFSSQSVLVSKTPSLDPEKPFYQIMVQIPDLTEGQCQGSLFQACQGTVDLLCLPQDFIERVKAKNGGLLLTITNRWFEMTTDPVQTRFLEIARLAVSGKKEEKVTMVLEPIAGEREKRKALQKGGPIFVVARDAFPPLKGREF